MVGAMMLTGSELSSKVRLRNGNAIFLDNYVSKMTPRDVEMAIADHQTRRKLLTKFTSQKHGK